MSKQCPIFGRALYLDCLDCEEKLCMQKTKYRSLCIGIDQSYKNTGVSVSADGVLKKVGHIDLEHLVTNSEKRQRLRSQLDKICSKLVPQASSVVCIIERIRLRSQGFLNIDYIKSIGALNAIVADVMSAYGIKVYSVDTRCWKSQVVGTSKPMSNRFGVPDEKWPTVRWCIKKGFRDSILVNMDDSRKSKGTFVKDGSKWMYDNDASDSAAISMFWFVGEHDKLKQEK